jgi:hypothetical protein
MMAEILQTDPSKPNFDATTLTVVEASAKHNILWWFHKFKQHLLL